MSDVHEAPEPAGCAAECAELLRDLAAKTGVDMDVSAIPFDRGYEAFNMRCPHGFLWYVQPTEAQIAEWVILEVP